MKHLVILPIMVLSQILKLRLWDFLLYDCAIVFADMSCTHHSRKLRPGNVCPVCNRRKFRESFPVSEGRPIAWFSYDPKTGALTVPDDKSENK